MVRLPVKCGLDFIRDSNWRPRMFTRKGLQRYGNIEARKLLPTGFWTACVSDTGYGYWRLSFGGQPEK